MNRCTYVVYPLQPGDGGGGGEGDRETRRTAAQVQEVAAQLYALRDRMMATIAPFVKEHLWHKEPFVLDVFVPQVPAAAGRPACLVGQTRFGDCIDDEWFIVFLLRELTRKFDVAVSATDNDGEFLLIESAMVLPAWIDPDNSENRVFIYKGKLCIVPMPLRPETRGVLPATTPTVSGALQILRDNFGLVDSSASLQRPVDIRLGEFPLKTRQLLHHARCVVPLTVAHLLHHCPQLVAPAVDAFYHRDSTGMKACATMSRFHPTMTKSVETTVTFTRYLYAQLIAQNFYAPKPFQLPPAKSADFAMHELGMKLTCGFEILCAQHGDDAKSSGEQSRWQHYVSNLTQLGYFREYLPASKPYKELEEQARSAFLATESAKQESATSAPAIGLEFSDPVAKIEQLLAVPVIEDAVVSTAAPDSDRWLSITENEPLFQGEKDKDVEGLKSMADILSSFMQKSSGLEGVEFAEDLLEDDLKEEDSDEEDDDDYDDDDDDTSGSDEDTAKTPAATAQQKKKANKISFDLDTFLGIFAGATATTTTTPASSGATEAATAGDSDDDDGEEEEGVLEDYMHAMDKELASTEALSGFEREPTITSAASEATEPSVGPIDLDVNLVKNILESVGAQHGLAGPISNLLGSLHLSLPAIAADDVEDVSSEEESS